MQNLRYFACVVAALGAVAVAGCTSSSDSGPDARLHVRNSSDFAIESIQVTSVGSTTWGPNLLGSDILATGETLDVDVSCDTYDARLMDETGVECEVHDISLCFSTADWVITNDTCPVFSVARAAREAAAAAAGSSAGSSTPAAP
jgi:hypothetical protein